MHAITSDFEGGKLIVFIDRDIDHHNASALRKAIDEEIGKYRPDLVILNFDAVEFMDSSAIGLIMGRYKLIKNAGGELRIAALNTRCRKLIELSGITQLVKSL